MGRGANLDQDFSHLHIVISSDQQPWADIKNLIVDYLVYLHRSDLNFTAFSI
jgi:hypothetical protein